MSHIPTNNEFISNGYVHHKVAGKLSILVLLLPIKLFMASLFNNCFVLNNDFVQ